MNRLWVRISLTFVGIVFFLIFVPLVVGILTYSFDADAFLEGEQLEEFQFEELGELTFAERLRTTPGRPVFEVLSTLIFAIFIIGSLGMVLITRRLTAPIKSLEQAAKAIGDKDLDHRVEVKGSAEIQSVALAFNDMANELSKAENLRTNLLNDVAHELRTPLSVIQGNLRAILDDVYDLDKAEIARLYDQTLQLSRLVDDLRELAQAEAQQISLNLSQLEVVPWLKESVAAFRPIAAEKEVSVQVEILGKHPLIQVDQARMTQSLHNLLSNALQHTPEGGAITVTVEQKSAVFTLRVIDAGEGIEAEHLPNIFDRFYRADPNRGRDTGGTGLGLAISKAIIEAHGGTIRAESAGANKGSQFIIQLTQ
ncbi:MAG: HAMP domain-containing protein [Anaerolineales bacterium]|nr:HAMP domain-containing protein [Chloroflexota bacterium]MBL6980190.1 HAMP domain-containing protein [Anaerolineales bacterium]